MGQFALGEFEGGEGAFDDAVEPRRFRAALRRSWPLVLAVVLPLTALVLAVSLLLPPTYRASATIALSEEGVGQAGDAELVGRELETLERIATTQPVLRTAARRLGVSIGSLEDKVSASASAEANVVLVTGEDGEAAGAARIANAVAGALLDKRAAEKRRSLAASRRALEARIARLRGTGRQALITTLRQALNEIAVEEARAAQSVVLAEPARAPESPASPRVLQNTLFALFGFVFIAVLIALVREQIAPRVHDARDLAHLLGAPILVEMPVPRSRHGRASIAHSGPFDLIAERLSELEPEIVHSVLVASPYRDQAAEVIASGVARALASRGERVALVDGGVSNTVTAGGPPGEEDADVIEVPDEAGALVTSRAAFEALLERLAHREVRHVVVVGRPLLAAGEGLLQASLVDAVVLACRPERMTRDEAARLGRQLRAGTANVLGLVSLGGKQVVPYRVSESSLESARL